MNAAFAEQAGDTVFSLGVAHLSPSTSLGQTNTTGSAAPDPAFGNVPAPAYFNAALSGASASIDSKNTVSTSLLHMFTDNIAAEFTIGIPPKMNFNISSPAAGSHPGAATAKVWTPALVGKYLFLDKSSDYRPYLGLGMTYVSFKDVTTNKNDPTVAAIAGTSASLDSKWEPVYNAGLIYSINDKWSINGSISYIPIKTDITLVGPGGTTGPVTTTGTLKINMVDYVVRLGYKF
jgi:outer membrane protein